MAELLKNLYSKTFLENFASSLEQVFLNFDKDSFINDVISGNWDDKELKQRMKHIAVVMKTYLHNDYEKDIRAILEVINQIKKNGVNKERLEYMFFPEFIENYGLDNFEVSMNAIEEVTQFISCEFAIRPFIKRYTEETMKRMVSWSKHSSESVRRLSSEGCRPRLPWAMALPDFKSDPKLILPILENLKKDSSEYVRRSVANNLNDIAKDNPEIVIAIAKRWKGHHKETDWIVKHGCRTLLKQANSEILKLFGFESEVNYEIRNFQIQGYTIQIGDNLEFSFELLNKMDKPVSLRIEYAIYYMKANGKQNKKIFKITENTYNNDVTYSFKRKQSFQNMTTRKHYLGKHKIAIIINGNEALEKEFMLI